MDSEREKTGSGLQRQCKKQSVHPGHDFYNGLCEQYPDSKGLRA